MRLSLLLVSVVLALCIGAYSSVEARDSGVELIVTQRTADYLNRKIIPILRRKLSGLSIPDQRYGRARVYSIRFGRLSIGSSRIIFTPAGATVALSNIGISGSARWKYKRWFFKVSGSIHMSLSSGHLSTTLSVASKGGRPDFNVGACSVSASVRVRFSGSFFSWLLNAFRGYIGRKVESYLRENTCKLLTDVLNKQETRLVTSYPTSLSFGKTLKFDISLTRDPKFGRNYLQLPFVGFTSPLITDKDLKALATKYPSASLTSAVRTHRMLFFRIKPYSLNAALLAYHRDGSFTHEFNVGDFNEYIQGIFGGNGFRGSDTYLCPNKADCDIKVTISSPEAPTIKLANNDIRVYGKAVVDVDLVNSKLSLRVNLLKVSVDGLLCGNLSIQQNGNRLTAYAQLTCAKAMHVSVGSSLFGKFSGDQLDKLVDQFIQQLLPKANTYLSTGLPLQQPGSFTIRDPILKVHPQYLELGANFAFNRW